MINHQQTNDSANNQSRQDNQHSDILQKNKNKLRSIKIQSETDSFTLGNAIFMSNVKEHIGLFKDKENIFSNQQWQIKNYQYQNQGWNHLFDKMISCTTSRIRLIDILNPQIINQISHINFQNLRDIILFGNNISNIQAVCWLNCKKLRLLSLSYNKIVRINSLQKWGNHQASSLFLNNNLVLQTKSLSRMKFSSQNIQDITFQVNSQDPIICQDLALIFKLQGENMEVFCHNRQARLQSQKMDQMILKKFPNINFKDENQD